MKKVTIFHSGSVKIIEVEESISTWGALKSVLNSQYSYIDDMRAVLRGTQTTLELEEAVLPEGDITLFLMARKTKSGSDLTRQNCYAIIKEIRENDEEARDFFGNYTNISTIKLREMIKEWDMKENEVEEKRFLTFDELSDYLANIHNIIISPEVLEDDIEEYLISIENFKKMEEELEAECERFMAELS